MTKAAPLDLDGVKFREVALSLQKAYNPDQPRNSDGRWGSGGEERWSASKPPTAEPTVVDRVVGERLQAIRSDGQDRGLRAEASALKDHVATEIAKNMKSSTDDMLYAARIASADPNSYATRPSVYVYSLERNEEGKLTAPSTTTFRADTMQDVRNGCDFVSGSDGALVGVKLGEGVSADDPSVRALLSGEDPAAPQNLGIAAAAGDFDSKFVASNSPEAETPFRERIASDLVHQWATTSNDDCATSLAIQECAREEFGLKNAAGWPPSWFEQSITPEEVKGEIGDTLKDFLRTQYEATQRAFAEQGLKSTDTLPLVRGVAEYPLPANGESFSGSLRPLSSFTTVPEIASRFSGENGGWILANVPVSSILSCPATGIGCLHESEVVVLGGTQEMKSVVVGRVDGELKIITKGTPSIDGSIQSSDWIKAGYWDLPRVVDLRTYMAARGLSETNPEALRAALLHDTALPFWRPAPPALQHEAQAFLETGQINKAISSAYDEALLLVKAEMALLDAKIAASALRQEVLAEIAATEREIRKASRSWASHPDHSIHDKIVAYYAPKMTAALNKSVRGIDAAVGAAYANYKPEAKKGIDPANMTPAQAAASEAIAAHAVISPQDATQVLRHIFTDSYVAGAHNGATLVGSGAAMPAGLDSVESMIDWSEWEPGWAEVADFVAAGGLEDLLDSAGITIRSVIGTALDRLTSVLANGLDAGTPASAIAEQLMAVDPETGTSIVSGNAMMIAVTETSRVMTQGNIDSYSANNIQQYEWLAEDDDRTCVICEELDGQVFDVADAASSGESDNSGDGEADVPDDGSGDAQKGYMVKEEDDPGVTQPPAHPWCRCKTLPVLEDIPGRDTSRDALSPEGDGTAAQWDEDSQSWVNPDQSDESAA